MNQPTYLLPCPFCGCTKSPVLQGNGIGDNWLECTDCGVSTRLREDGAGSTKDWNRRPAASAPAVDAGARDGLEAVTQLLVKWERCASDEAAKRRVDSVGIAAGIRSCAMDLRAALSARVSEAAAGEPVVAVKVSAQGVQFGNAWYSHERITGYSSEQLNAGDCHVTGRAYMQWVRLALTAPPAASGPHLPCPICNGVEGCDHTVPERARAAASGPKLTLSPKARDALDSACSFFEIHGFDDYVSELRALLRASSATASDKEGA